MGGEGLAGVDSLGEVEGDRLAVDGVAARCGLACDVAALVEGDTPVIEGEREFAPVAGLNLAVVVEQR